MGEILRLVLEFKAQELEWLLGVLGYLTSVVLAIVLWILLPGLISWAVIFGIIYLWCRVCGPARVLALFVGLLIVWFDWNFLAALLEVAGVVAATGINALLAASVLLIVGFMLWGMAICFAFALRLSAMERLWNQLTLEEGRCG